MIKFQVGESEMIMQDGEDAESFISQMVAKAMVERQNGDFRITADDAVVRIEKHPASVDDAHETLAEYLKGKCRMIVLRSVRTRHLERY
jgi:hypothetical protein